MKIFVEGGGDDRDTATRCRLAFAAFFAKVVAQGKLKPKVIPCGGRDPTLNAKLAEATKDTKKGPYHKTKHGFDLIARIDPRLVRAASSHADRLCRLVRGEPVE